MDKRILCWLVGGVLFCAGFMLLEYPTALFGTGSFYERNFGIIATARITLMIAGAICAAVGFAFKK